LKPALAISSSAYFTQKRPGGVAQGVGPEFKPQYHKKKKKKKKKRAVRTQWGQAARGT
jgi:hypothetical protein